MILARHPLTQPLDLTLLAATALGAIALSTAPIVRLEDPALSLGRQALVVSGAVGAIALSRRWGGLSPGEMFVTRAKWEAEVARREALAIRDQAERDRAALESEQNEVYARWQEIANAQAEEARAAIEEVQEATNAQLASYAAQLAAANAPKTFMGADLVSFVANQIQEVLWGLGIECDADRATETHTDHYLWLRPRKMVRLKEVQSAVAEIPCQVDGIFDAPSVTMEGGLILLRYPFNQPAAQAQAKAREESMVAEGYDWLRGCVLGSVHDLVAGQTGSGKSTLIANLIDLAQIAMLSEFGKDPAIWFVDPKWPDSEWRLHGQIVDPHYRGFERYTSPDGVEYPDALDGYRAMAQSVSDRLGAAQDDWFYDRATDRDPEIWICDEGEQMAASFGADASDPVQFVARVGRSTKVRLILIGQSPKCSAYKFKTISQLNNFTRYYLGEAVLGAIDEIGRTTIEKNRLRKTLQKLEAIALTDPGKQYFALVKQPSRPAYFAYLPPPGYYLQPSSPPIEVAPAPAPLPKAPPAVPPVSDRALLELVEKAEAEEAALMADCDRRAAVEAWDVSHPGGRMLDRLADCWPELRVKANDGSKSARGYQQARAELARLFPEKYPPGAS